MSVFNVEKLPIDGPLLITSEIYQDDRGYLFESWNYKELMESGIQDNFVQDKVSVSKKGVLRGLHYQYPHPQAKFVRVLLGEVYDVVVDLRPWSRTFGKWYGTFLSSSSNNALYIPGEFAHGFLALTDQVIFLYKTSDYFYPDCDSGIRWDDNEIGVEWPINLVGGRITISDKDRKLQSFESFRERILKERG